MDVQPPRAESAAMNDDKIIPFPTTQRANTTAIAHAHAHAGIQITVGALQIMLRVSLEPDLIEAIHDEPADGLDRLARRLYRWSKQVWLLDAIRQQRLQIPAVPAPPAPLPPGGLPASPAASQPFAPAVPVPVSQAA